MKGIFVYYYIEGFVILPPNPQKGEKSTPRLLKITIKNKTKINKDKTKIKNNNNNFKQKKTKKTHI